MRANPPAGTHCVVTGAGSGMGRATALRLAREGARLTLIDNDAARTEETARLLVELGARHLTQICDVSSPDAVEAAFARAEEELGPVYLLAAAAGKLRGAFVLDSDAAATLRELLAVNLEGVLMTNRCAVRSMLRGGQEGRTTGRIVNWSSIGAPGGTRGYSAYCATKAAVESLTRTLAVEVAAHGITVNAISAGAVTTPMTTAARPAPQGPVTPPIGRPASADEVASLVAYLAGPEAEYITGTVLAIDGGLQWGRLGALSEASAVERLEALQGRPPRPPGAV